LAENDPNGTFTSPPPASQLPLEEVTELEAAHDPDPDPSLVV
jgi:hypothetical protein